MVDELNTKVTEAIAYLEHNSDTPTVFCIVASILLDYRSYVKPRKRPADALRKFVHEAVLTSGPVKTILRQDDICKRSLHDGMFHPSAFGLPTEKPSPESKPKYDVCISYAREDREIALRLAKRLKKEYNLDVFFDEFEQHKLVGHQLTEMLYSVYARDSLLCVPLFSKAYAEKDWTRHELRAARDRAIRTHNRPYIFPVLLEDGAVPTDLVEVSYWHYKPRSEAKIVDEINARVHEWVRENMFSIEEATEMVNDDLLKSDIADGFRQGIKERNDSEYSQALWILGLLAIVSRDEVVKSVGALLDYVATAVPDLLADADSEGRFKVFGTATVTWSFGSHGPLLFSTDGWSTFIGDRAKARREYFESEMNNYDDKLGDEDGDMAE